MKKREYPAFIIDRSRQSAASRATDDFIVCTDRGSVELLKKMTEYGRA